MTRIRTNLVRSLLTAGGISVDIAFELGAVVRIVCAPPSSCNECAGFIELLSIYRLAPSFLASGDFSAPRPIAATL